MGLRAELRALEQENDALQRTLKLSSGLRQRFETLFDASPLGLLSCDSDDQIVEANLTITNLLQAERAQLIGQHFGKFVAPADHARFIQHLNQVRDRKHETDTHCDITLVTTEQTHIPVRIQSHIENASNYHNETVHSQISLLEETTSPANNIDLAKTNAQLKKEIADRKLAEEESRLHQEELAHVDRLNTMGEMASGLAHEINQPLTAINSYTKSCLRLLQGDSEKQAQVPFLLEHVCKQTQRAASIIRHLRDFVSKNTPHREPTDSGLIIKQAVNMMRGELNKHDISLDLKIPADPPQINADAIQIEQVIINIMRNACEAMSNSDTRLLHIELDKADDTHLRIIISDTGPGIEPNNAEKIPTPFFSTKPNGMGLGLTISRTIIEDHGGKLTHETNIEGGASFIITLSINGKPE